MNNVYLIGRIASEPEIRRTASDMAVTSFPLAVDRGKGRDGEDKGADFPRVTVFGKTAENIGRFSGKGLRIAVAGRIQTGSYTNNSGDKVYTTEVVADRIEFIDWKESRSETPQGFEAIEDEDLPF